LPCPVLSSSFYPNFFASYSSPSLPFSSLSCPTQFVCSVYGRVEKECITSCTGAEIAQSL
jgi:hypothetical protein